MFFIYKSTANYQRTRWKFGRTEPEGTETRNVNVHTRVNELSGVADVLRENSHERLSNR